MRLGYVYLFVADVEAAASFYGRAFGLELDHVDAGTYAELRTGATRIGLVAVDHARAHRQAEPPRGGLVGLLADDVAAAFARAVDAGAAAVTEPYEPPWGPTARVADPDGNLVELSVR